MSDYEALDPERNQRRREERQQLEREEATQEQVDLQLLMDEPWGRRIAHRLLERTGVFRLSFDADNPHKTSFNEGQRNTGNWLLAQLMRTTPDQYATMLEEHHNAHP